MGPRWHGGEDTVTDKTEKRMGGEDLQTISVDNSSEAFPEGGGKEQGGGGMSWNE